MQMFAGVYTVRMTLCKSGELVPRAIRSVWLNEKIIIHATGLRVARCVNNAGRLCPSAGEMCWAGGALSWVGRGCVSDQNSQEQMLSRHKKSAGEGVPAAYPTCDSNTISVSLSTEVNGCAAVILSRGSAENEPLAGAEHGQGVKSQNKTQYRGCSHTLELYCKTHKSINSYKKLDKETRVMIVTTEKYGEALACMNHKKLSPLRSPKSWVYVLFVPP